MPSLDNISSIWMWAYRSSLQAMKKDNKESIREYTQRWCETTIQVNPYLSEKEMINLFANTFKVSYFEYLLESST